MRQRRKFNLISFPLRIVSTSLCESRLHLQLSRNATRVTKVPNVSLLSKCRQSRIIRSNLLLNCIVQPSSTNIIPHALTTMKRASRKSQLPECSFSALRKSWQLSQLRSLICHSPRSLGKSLRCWCKSRIQQMSYNLQRSRDLLTGRHNQRNDHVRSNTTT